MVEEPDVREHAVRGGHVATVRDTVSRNVLVEMCARMGYLVSRFFIPPFVLAHVSLAAYGLWATAFIFVSYIGISTLGISNVYIKYVAEYAALRDYDRANRLLSTGLAITVPTCALVFAGLCVLWPRLVAWLHIPANLRGDAHEVLLVVIAIFLASISLSAFRDTLTGMQQNASALYIWVAAYLLETALIFLLVGLGRGIRGLAEAFLLRTTFEIAMSTFLAYRKLPWLRIRLSLFSREALRVLFSYGGVVQMTALLAIFLNSVERAIAAPLAGLAATGLLDIGQKLPSMAASIPSAFSGALLPAASYLQGGLTGSDEQKVMIRKLYLKGARYMNLSAAYVCGFLAMLPTQVLHVWMNKEYAGAAYLMVIFAVATQVHLMTAPGTSILKGVGRPKEEFYYAVPNLIALAIFLPLARLFFGAWTALSIGTAVPAATIVSAAIFIWRANKQVNVSGFVYWRSVLLPGIVPYCLALPFTFILPPIVQGSSRLGEAGVLVLAGLVYSLVLLLAVDRLVWDTGERLWFHAILQNKVGRLLRRKVAAAA